MAASNRNGAQPDPEDRNEWGMPKMREPDWSDVRRHIFAPTRILIFIVISLIFWLLYYHFFPNTGARPPLKHEPPAASETQK
jgi:hypothetical protein